MDQDMAFIPPDRPGVIWIPPGPATLTYWAYYNRWCRTVSFTLFGIPFEQYEEPGLN